MVTNCKLTPTIPSTNSNAIKSLNLICVWFNKKPVIHSLNHRILFVSDLITNKSFEITIVYFYQECDQCCKNFSAIADWIISRISQDWEMYRNCSCYFFYLVYVLVYKCKHIITHTHTMLYLLTYLHTCTLSLSTYTYTLSSHAHTPSIHSAAHKSAHTYTYICTVPVKLRTLHMRLPSPFPLLPPARTLFSA